MKLRSVGFKLVLAATLSAASIVSSATSVFASCNPGRSNNGRTYWVYRFQGTATGIFSKITVYKPYVLNGFSYSWVMLPGPSNYEWAQVGPYEYPSGTMRTVVQWADPTSPPPHYQQMDFAAEPVGSKPTFEVLYIPSLQKYEMFDNGSLLKSVVITSWIPAGGEIAGEITTYANQMMGASSANEVFDLNQIQYSGSWHTFNGVLPNYDPAFGESGSGAKFNIWDGACSS